MKFFPELQENGTTINPLKCIRPSHTLDSLVIGSHIKGYSLRKRQRLTPYSDWIGLAMPLNCTRSLVVLTTTVSYGQVVHMFLYPWLICLGWTRKHSWIGFPPCKLLPTLVSTFLSKIGTKLNYNTAWHLSWGYHPLQTLVERSATKKLDANYDFTDATTVVNDLQYLDQSLKIITC